MSVVPIVTMGTFSHSQSMAAVMPDRVQPRCGDLHGILQGVARANEFLKKFPRQHVPRGASVLSGPEAKASPAIRTENVSQSRRPAVDVSSTLSQYQQPKEAGSRKTGAKSSPRKHKNRANRRNQQSVPTPRAGLEAETEGESQKVRLQARRAGRPAPVDADEKRVLCCFSVLNVRP